MPLNVPLLLKIKAHILEEPNRFVMDSLILKREDIGADYIADDDTTRVPFPSCGTAACIAGWACLLSLPGSVQFDLWGKAVDLLGLEGNQADLFCVSSWPSSFREDYEEATTQAGRAVIAANRIDALIAELAAK